MSPRASPTPPASDTRMRRAPRARSSERREPPVRERPPVPEEAPAPFDIPAQLHVAGDDEDLLPLPRPSEQLPELVADERAAPEGRVLLDAHPVDGGHHPAV